jgi:hypothetical protein
VEIDDSCTLIPLDKAAALANAIERFLHGPPRETTTGSRQPAVSEEQA